MHLTRQNQQNILKFLENDKTMKRFAIFLSLLFIQTVILSGTGILCADETTPSVAKRPVRVVHITDLFRPHSDPDDHWDLATQYALATRGDIDLVGVVIDYPKPEWGKDPDISAVAQLNFITGRSVPVMTGVPDTFSLDADMKDPVVRNSPELSGVRALHRILRDSPDPVVITVTGWCRDLIFIYKYDPELFAKKCAGVYLNAGLGIPDTAKQETMEWNVIIDPAAYAQSFSLPVPVYWLPCFHTRDHKYYGPDSCNGSYFRFLQSEILPELSDPMQNFFLSMFRDGEKGPGKSDWLTILHQKPDQKLLERESKNLRHMWCTGGMLHMAGKTVLTDGTIVPINEAGNKAVYTFRPIKITCDKDGRTSWVSNEGDKTGKGPFVFEVRDMDNYYAAMGKALKGLILELGTKEKK